MGAPGYLAVLCSFVLVAGARAGWSQCIPNQAPVSFEPNPPGPAGPRNVALLSPQSMYHLALFQNGPAGPWRILMQETFGYSVLDLTNPASPSVVRWDYMPFDTNKVEIHGDGQSYVQAIGASPDGQRVALSLTGPASPPWNTVVGSPDDRSGFTMWGDTPPVGGVGTAVVQAAGRYVHFGLTSDNLYASDVTTLPGVFAPFNVPFEKTSYPGGGSLAVAGNYLTYVTNVGTIQVIDASHPGPAGSIAASLPRTTIGASSFFGHAPGAVKTALDPTNPRKLWVLVELQSISGENSPSYALVSLTEDTGGNFSAPVSAGPAFRIPSVAGETWTSAGSSAALAAHQGLVYVLMWGFRRTPSYQYVLYSTSTAEWGAQAPVTISTAGFSLGDMKTLSVGSTLYAYLATGGNAWVLPMTCQSPNAKATSILTAVNASNGAAPVASGDPVPYGDTLTFAPLVVPFPSLQPLTSWRFRFDFDFHAGAVEDAGAASPRLLNDDADQFQFPPTPPSAANLVGPCDPRAGGVPATGAGCWSSVRTNGSQTASGQPDFSGSEAPGTLTPQVVALEANNKNGSSGPDLFTVNWKRPAVRLVNAQILSGGTLTGAPDGHPSATGWKWYFGDAPASLALQAGCTTTSCVPTGAASIRGTHWFWITVPYAQIGYTTPDYTGAAAIGTYSVIDFSPTFSVNGSTTGPLSVLVGQNMNVVNTSPHGAGVVGNGGYGYNLCQIPNGQTTCAAGAFTAWPAMSDPPAAGTPGTSAAIPSPPPGSWLLRIRVNYQNPSGSVLWPDGTGATGIPITAVAPIPEIRIFVNGADPCPPGPGVCTPNHFSARVGDSLKAYSYVNGSPDPNDGSVSLQWAFPGGAPDTSVNQAASYTYGYPGVYDVTLTRAGIPYVYPSAVTVLPLPISPSASASPPIVGFGAGATFTCSATGGVAPYTYTWRFSDGGTGAGSPATHGFTASGTGTGTCTVTDSWSATATAQASVNVLPLGSGGPYGMFVLDPCRALDTRWAAGPTGGPSIGAAGTPDRTFPIGSSCALPPDAKAVIANVTVTNASAGGTISIYRGDGSRTGTTTSAFNPRVTRANNAILQVALDGSGTIRIQNLSPQAVDVIIDVSGYYR